MRTPCGPEPGSSRASAGSGARGLREPVRCRPSAACCSLGCGQHPVAPTLACVDSGAPGQVWLVWACHCPLGSAAGTWRHVGASPPPSLAPELSGVALPRPPLSSVQGRDFFPPRRGLPEKQDLPGLLQGLPPSLAPMSVSTEGRATRGPGQGGRFTRVPRAAETEVGRQAVWWPPAHILPWVVLAVPLLLRGACLLGAGPRSAPSASAVGPEPAGGECLPDGGDSWGCRDGPCAVRGARCGVRATECDCRHAAPGLGATVTRLHLGEPPLPLCAPMTCTPCVWRNPALWTVWCPVLDPEVLHHHTQSPPHTCAHGLVPLLGPRPGCRGAPASSSLPSPEKSSLRVLQRPRGSRTHAERAAAREAAEGSRHAPATQS